MTDDGELLRAYAQSGSEEAFGELVRRHLDLVYCTALRGVNGDEAHARDISQTVFIDLARKAAVLCHRPLLTGWLYTSTCFAAAKAVRSERRRKAREEEVHAMRDQMTSGSESTDWERIRPVLDSLMLELKEPEREALLMRFFERRSLAEVGSRLGLSENAARMRVERALERLHERLAKRGISSSAAALGLVLAHQAAAAAPFGLAASITSGTLAATTASSGYSILELIAMTKTKTILIASVLAATAATPIILQHQANTRLKTQLEALQAQPVSAAAVAQGAEVESAAAGDTAGLEQLRREHSELLRLRSEVTALKRAASDARDSEARLRAQKLANDKSEGEALLAKSPEIAMVPAHLWTNSGFSTPAASLQTYNWAVANRDTNAFLQTLGWDQRAKERADALFGALPEAVQSRYGTVDGVIFDWLLTHETPIAASRVLSEVDEGPNEATLTEQHIYDDGRVRENTVQLQRDQDGSWRQVLPQELIPKLQKVLQDLTGTTAVGAR